MEAKMRRKPGTEPETLPTEWTPLRTPTGHGKPSLTADHPRNLQASPNRTDARPAVVQC